MIRTTWLNVNFELELRRQRVNQLQKHWSALKGQAEKAAAATEKSEGADVEQIHFKPLLHSDQNIAFELK